MMAIREKKITKKLDIFIGYGINQTKIKSKQFDQLINPLNKIKYLLLSIFHNTAAGSTGR